jgi:prephenate dehydratase
MTLSSNQKMGYLGIPGTYSHQAANVAAEGATHKGYPTFLEVLTALKDEIVDAAVFPIINSRTGHIPQVREVLLGKKWVQTVQKITLPVDHALIVKSSDTDISDIDTVLSHPQGFLQCTTFLTSRLERAQKLETGDTASAVKMVTSGYTSGYGRCAAIGSTFAAQYYGAHILCDAINDDPKNTTTFSVMMKRTR